MKLVPMAEKLDGWDVVCLYETSVNWDPTEMSGLDEIV